MKGMVNTIVIEICLWPHQDYLDDILYFQSVNYFHQVSEIKHIYKLKTIDLSVMAR